MKTLSAVLFCVAMTMAMPAAAEQKETTVSFTYPEIPADNIIQPEKFLLYKGPEKVCEESDTTVRSFSCPVSFTALDVVGDRAEAPFTMTVLDNRGRETEPATPYVAGFGIGDLPLLPTPALIGVEITP